MAMNNKKRVGNPFNAEDRGIPDVRVINDAYNRMKMADIVCWYFAFLGIILAIADYELRGIKHASIESNRFMI